LVRTPRTIRQRHGQWRSLWRALRYRFIVPVFRSPHPPEYTARGVANGVFWGLTPSVGLQTVAIVATWLVAHKLCRRPSSLLQAFIWVWVNNPVTMVPMYYLFYVTGLWLLGEAGPANGYDTFVALWDANTAGGWFDGLVAIARSIGVPIVIGSAPYATTGGALSYRWALRVVRRRKARVFEATVASVGPSKL
jgi:uncharacterized protein (DUF2062 family)